MGITRKDDLTSQVDGITDIFTTNYEYQGGTLMLGYNGQMYPVGVNIESELTNTTFQLCFVPDLECTDSLHVVYEDFFTADEPLIGTGRPPGC